METIAGFIIIILILLWLLGSKLMGGGKTVYKIEPRESNISSVKLSDDSGFDTIGWLRVQGTSIDYPIIQAVEDVEKDFPHFEDCMDINDYFKNRNKRKISKRV